MGSENISGATKYLSGSIQMFTDYFPTWTAIDLEDSATHPFEHITAASNIVIQDFQYNVPISMRIVDTCSRLLYYVDTLYVFVPEL